MTLQGTPSDRGSIPIGTPEEVRAESRGLLTRTRYNETPLADEVLEAIRTGGITAQSYTGRILRSSPELRRGEKYRPGRDGRLPTVRRLELALREYGPTPFPAFSGAEILGVRMSTPGEYAPGPDDPQEDEALPPDGEPAAGDPLTRREEAMSTRPGITSTRSTRSAPGDAGEGRAGLVTRPKGARHMAALQDILDEQARIKNELQRMETTRRPPRKTTGTSATPCSSGGRNSTTRPSRSSSGWSRSRPSPAPPQDEANLERPGGAERHLRQPVRRPRPGGPHPPRPVRRDARRPGQHDLPRRTPRTGPRRHRDRRQAGHAPATTGPRKPP